MTITIEQLEKWMAAPSEDEQIHVAPCVRIDVASNEDSQLGVLR
jgi:hypothetical protein